jgi:hypothetical protein
MKWSYDSIMYQRPPRKPDPVKPAEWECHCEYEKWVMEINVDRLDLSSSDYLRIIRSCPVHGS